ncbi:hypothetical protein CQA86_32535, partial [Klebsiella pneumoniae]
GLAALENIRLTSSDGGIVPLTAIATVEQRLPRSSRIPRPTPGLAALENIRLTSSDGGIVPLTAIATVEQRLPR